MFILFSSKIDEANSSPAFWDSLLPQFLFTVFSPLALLGIGFLVLPVNIGFYVIFFVTPILTIVNIILLCVACLKNMH